MAKEIIWSPLANQKLKEILEFWIEHNKSHSYSIKLNNLFEEAAHLISEYPNMGKLTDDKTARFKIVRDYLMIYEELEDNIRILTIWGTRQNPDELKLR